MCYQNILINILIISPQNGETTQTIGHNIGLRQEFRKAYGKQTVILTKSIFFLQTLQFFNQNFAKTIWMNGHSIFEKYKI